MLEMWGKNWSKVILSKQNAKRINLMEGYTQHVCTGLLMWIKKMNFGNILVVLVFGADVWCWLFVYDLEKASAHEQSRFVAIVRWCVDELKLFNQTACSVKYVNHMNSFCCCFFRIIVENWETLRLVYVHACARHGRINIKQQLNSVQIESSTTEVHTLCVCVLFIPPPLLRCRHHFSLSHCSFSIIIRVLFSFFFFFVIFNSRLVFTRASNRCCSSSFSYLSRCRFAVIRFFLSLVLPVFFLCCWCV